MKKNNNKLMIIFYSNFIFYSNYYYIYIYIDY